MQAGKKKWIGLAISAVTVNESSVRLSIILNSGMPGIVNYDEQILHAGINTVFPVLRFCLNTNKPDYALFRDLKLERYTIDVSVAADNDNPGVRGLILQNDQGPLNANQAFLPFGPVPESGAHFFIGSEEVFSKPLTSLKLVLKWSGLPGEALANYYQFYDSFTFDDIRAQTAFLVNGAFISGPEITILDSVGLPVDQPGVLSINQIPLLNTGPSLDLKQGLTAGLKQGFLRLTLKGDFGNKAYLKSFAIASWNKDVPNFPNPPYTATLQSVSLGYTAFQKADFVFTQSSAQFFYLEPFGTRLVESYSPAINLLPPFFPDAALYIGIKDLLPPQNLQLLFQVSESPPEATGLISKNDIGWEWLGEKEWIAFHDHEIFSDDCLGLQKSGIIGFNIPRAASTESGMMPKGVHWLRAKLLNHRNPEASARMIAVHAQAVSAIFSDHENDASHLAHPLPADSIKSLSKKLAAIKKTSQPYASFGGYPAEEDVAFYTRVSERLRHRQRAVTLWDVERLVLQYFNNIYKAKCIPHTGVDKGGYYSEFMPGQLTVVVIPQILYLKHVKKLEPKASVALMQDIRNYLLHYSGYFTRQGNTGALHVTAPHYEQVLLSFSVGFYEGFDSGFYAAVLNEDLRRHLSPWAYEDGTDIAFGGKIYKSQLLAFVEEREYVDYVTDFRMYQLGAGPAIEEMSVDIDLVVRTNYPGDAVDIAEASTAASILVSAPEHIINILQPDDYPCVMPDDICTEGIGCWYIDINFTVT